MTLQELSPQYARQAETMAGGSGSCGSRSWRRGTPRRPRPSARGSRSCGPCCREARELAEHTAHYYDRRYIRREKYRI